MSGLEESNLEKDYRGPSPSRDDRPKAQTIHDKDFFLKTFDEAYKDYEESDIKDFE